MKEKNKEGETSPSNVQVDTTRFIALCPTTCSAEEVFRQALLEICSTPDKGQLCEDALWMKERAERALKGY